jgi:cobalamin biosynthesis Co2+ chelatase CbiK
LAHCFLIWSFYSLPTINQQVLKTLEDRGTVSKTREDIETFVTAIKSELSVTKEETLQLINHAPSTILDAYLCLEQAIFDDRISEDQLDRVVELVNQYLLQ